MSGEPLSLGLPASLSVLRAGGKAGEAIWCCMEQTVLQPVWLHQEDEGGRETKIEWSTSAELLWFS